MTDNALYLEVDEDITSAIDKLAKVHGESVQIVVPKRSTMLQSMINLKLLKKAAKDNHKELVLVTNDRIATDLAARVGLAIAPSIGAKPHIADSPVPEQLKSAEEVIDASDPEPPELPTTPPPDPKPKRLNLKRRELSEDESADTAAVAVSDGAPSTDDANAKPAKKKKPIKIPDWNLLQKRAIWAGILVIAVVGYFAVMYFFTGANVVLYANGQSTTIATSFTADPTVNRSNPGQALLAAKQISVAKSLSGSFTPTGKQDIGTKATGTMTISNSYDSNSHTFVSGTRFVDANGNTFLSTSDVTIPGASLSGGQIVPGTATVAVQADQNGSQYNEGPGTYSIPGLPSSEQSGQNAITAHGGTMSGGTSKVVTIVSQGDITTAQNAVLSQDKPNITNYLKGQVPAGYVAIVASQGSSVSGVTSSPSVDAQATSANISLKVTYTELVVKTADYRAMLDAQEQSQIGSSSEIYNDGFANLSVTQTSTSATGAQTFSLTAVASSGPKLDTSAIAKALSGKKYGDASDYVKGLAGVSDATISIWPSWASSLPSRADRIHVSVKVQGGS